MGDKKFLHADKLRDWLQELSKEFSVYAPQMNGSVQEFAQYTADSEISLDLLSTEPPKKVLFPQTEYMFRYKYEKSNQDLGGEELQLTEDLPQDKPLIFACRPCDAAGFQIFDSVFAQKEISDPYYKNRRDKACIVSLACTIPDNTCFCNWVGGGPTDPQGSDVMLFPVQEGYLLEPITDKGEQLLNYKGFETAGEKATEAEELKQSSLEKMPQFIDLGDVPQKLLDLFENMEFWEQVSNKCISCGVCTYLCPTCYCFNISDESAGKAGKRIRSWDSCMYFLFTLEASGHNPRSSKAHRLRNRIGHKFSYHPHNHAGIFACSGCGRCIKYCPANVDIREVIQLVKEYKDVHGE